MIPWIHFVLKCLYLFLPVYFSNMAPVILKKIPLPHHPVDFGKSFRGKRIFGANKSWKGIFLGVILAIIISFIQVQYLNHVPFFDTLILIEYSNWLLVGFMMGLGGLLGDLIESFFKRQLGIGPGKPLYIIDQIDYVLVGLLFTSFVLPLTWLMAGTIIIVSIVLTIIVNQIAYYTKIRKVRW
ncbi:MAG: CDP-archaeol synthase [archaeon]